MSNKFSARAIINSLENGQFKQAKEQTLEGLAFLLSDVSFLVSDDNPTRMYQADTLAYRVCCVMLLLAKNKQYSLMLDYSNLFK